MLKFIYQYFLIACSGLFDPRYYLLMYPDVRKADIDPIWHFIHEGWEENRNPSKEFNTRFYLATNPDVKHSKVNPLVHFIRHGKKEGRITIPKLTPKSHDKYEMDNKNKKSTIRTFLNSQGKTTIFLHVGDTKTGTSIIQNFLDINRFKLYSYHNCLYPNIDSKHMEAGRFHNHGMWYKSIKENKQQFLDDVNSILEFSETNHMNKVILSFEEWLLDQEFTDLFINSYNKAYNLKVICYLRRIDFWCQSAWKQWGLKISKDIEEFIKAPKIGSRYRFIQEKLDQWAEIIGKDNIIIRPYEKQQLNKGIIHDFLSSIGLNAENTNWNNTEDKNIATNAGFNTDVLQILYYCQELFSDVHDNHMFDLFSTLLGIEYMKPPFESYSLLSPQMRYDLYSRNLKYEMNIAKKFLNSDNGKIFKDPIPDSHEPWHPSDKIELEKAIPIIIKMIDGNNKLINNILEKIDNLENKA